MKQRVAALVGNRARAMWVSTFHSMCVRLLRAEAKHLGFKSSFSIYDADDSKRLMTMVGRELDLDPKRYPARSLSAQISNLKNELVTPEAWADKASNAHREGAGRRLHPLPGPAARRPRARLRRPDHDLGPPAAGVPGRRRPLPAPVPARAGRRVPGHQPRPVHAGARADHPRAEEPVRAGRAGRGRRRRPVDLRLPRRLDPQHPRVRARLPRRHHDPARAELPLDPDDPQRRERRHLAQRRPPPEEPVVRRRRRARRSAATSPRTSTTRRRGWPSRSTRCPTPARPRRPDVAVFYRTNAQSRVFEEVFIRVGLPYKVVGGVRFYERKEIRDALAYLRVIANPDDVVSLRRILNTPRRGIGDRAEACVEVFADQERISFGAALERADVVPGLAGRLAERDPGLHHDDDRAARRSRPAPTACPARSSRPSSTAPGTCASSRRRTTRRTSRGSTTCAS